MMQATDVISNSPIKAAWAHRYPTASSTNSTTPFSPHIDHHLELEGATSLPFPAVFEVQPPAAIPNSLQRTVLDTSKQAAADIQAGGRAVVEQHTGELSGVADTDKKVRHYLI